MITSKILKKTCLKSYIMKAIKFYVDIDIFNKKNVIIYEEVFFTGCRFNRQRMKGISFIQQYEILCDLHMRQLSFSQVLSLFRLHFLYGVGFLVHSFIFLKILLIFFTFCERGALDKWI